MKQLGRLLVWLTLLLCGLRLYAQPHVPNELVDVESAPTAIGITILGSPAVAVGSVDTFTNGVSVEHNTLQLSLSLGLSWSIQVRATSDLQYKSFTIPVSAISVQALTTGGRSEFRLSTANQTLATGLLTTLLSLTMPIRYRAVNGSDFLKPGGAYTTTLVFTYTAL
ncbi:hypothetical protein [Spirosoma rigui]|uniref:hypothetical protein n=1 Tax=Spirosoma rigui TaxID=564064 RepID=UPI0009AF2EB7|nr:hypothetical protein [Spirosoma rigui]